MSIQTHGTELTRYDPFYFYDEEGGLRCRVMTDDGTVYWRKISCETALRTISKLALYLSRKEEGGGKE